MQTEHSVFMHLNWPAQVHLIYHVICKILEGSFKRARGNEKETEINMRENMERVTMGHYLNVLLDK